MQILRARGTAMETEYLIVGWSEQECLLASTTTARAAFTEEYVTCLSDLVAAMPTVVTFVSGGLCSVLRESRSSLLYDAGARPGRSVIVLVERRMPPLHSRRADGIVNSFCCSGGLFADLLTYFPDAPLDEYCFNLLYSISNHRFRADRLLVRQLPFCSTAMPVPQSRTGVVMAHRGPVPFLQTALQFIRSSDIVHLLDVHVGLDTDDQNELRFISSIIGADSMSLSRVVPSPAGPYVLRQHLVEECRNSTIAFHDSDDISTEDRMSRQYYELQITGADLTGCHELRLDEINRRVEAIRFPLDVSRALDVQAAASSTFLGDEPLLHATAMVRRQGFIHAGGFSTDQKIANDTQFMLRAYFSLTMRNVDEFLYVRRIHNAALTSAPDTALGTPLRRSLAALWKHDFDAIKAGRLQLNNSSLMPRRTDQQYAFVPVELLPNAQWSDDM